MTRADDLLPVLMQIRNADLIFVLDKGVVKVCNVFDSRNVTRIEIHLHFTGSW